MKRLLTILLPILVLPLLGGCAIAPDYRYSDSGDGGYYYGEAPYGGASTVIYGSGYSGYYNPWGYNSWGYGGYYGSGYWGPRLGTSIYYYDRGNRHYRGHRGHDYRGSGTRHEQPQRTQPRGDWDADRRWRAPTRWRGNTQSQSGRATSQGRTQSTARPQHSPAPVMQSRPRPSVRSSAPRVSRPAAAPRGRAIPKSALPDD
jgi:hypothetical protein